MLDLLGLGPQLARTPLLASAPSGSALTRGRRRFSSPVAVPLRSSWRTSGRRRTLHRRLLVRPLHLSRVEWLDPQPRTPTRLEAYADLRSGMRGGGHPGLQPSPVARGAFPRWHAGRALLRAASGPGPRSRAAGSTVALRGHAGAFAPLVAASPDLRRVHVVPGLVPGSLLDLATVAAARREFLLGSSSPSSPPSGSRCPRCTCASSGGPWTRWHCPPGCSPDRRDLYRDDRSCAGSSRSPADGSVRIDDGADFHRRRPAHAIPPTTRSGLNSSTGCTPGRDASCRYPRWPASGPRLVDDERVSSPVPTSPTPSAQRAAAITRRRTADRARSRGSGRPGHHRLAPQPRRVHGEGRATWWT